MSGGRYGGDCHEQSFRIGECQVFHARCLAIIVHQVCCPRGIPRHRDAQ